MDDVYDHPSGSSGLTATAIALAILALGVAAYNTYRAEQLRGELEQTSQTYEALAQSLAETRIELEESQALNTLALTRELSNTSNNIRAINQQHRQLRDELTTLTQRKHVANTPLQKPTPSPKQVVPDSSIPVHAAGVWYVKIRSIARENPAPLLREAERLENQARQAHAKAMRDKSSIHYDDYKAAQRAAFDIERDAQRLRARAENPRMILIGSDYLDRSVTADISFRWHERLDTYSTNDIIKLRSQRNELSDSKIILENAYPVRAED